jgi:hypothetical protein
VPRAFVSHRNEAETPPALQLSHVAVESLPTPQTVPGFLTDARTNAAIGENGKLSPYEDD